MFSFEQAKVFKQQSDILKQEDLCVESVSYKEYDGERSNKSHSLVLQMYNMIKLTKLGYYRDL